MFVQSKKLLMKKASVTTYTLTVSLNPASATCTLTYDGAAHTATSATVSAGTIISYSVYHSTYGTTTGTITMDADKTLTCTGTYSTTTQEITWSQPVLTSNGTLGGTNELAVQASSQYSTFYAWKAFDGNETAGNVWATGSGYPQTMLMYTYKPIKVTSFTIVNRSGYNGAFTSGSVYGGDTSSTSTTLVSSWSNSTTSSAGRWTINVNSPSFLHYHKISFASGTWASGMRAQEAEIYINAKKQQTSYTYYWDVSIT